MKKLLTLAVTLIAGFAANAASAFTPPTGTTTAPAPISVIIAWTGSAIYDANNFTACNETDYAKSDNPGWMSGTRTFNGGTFPAGIVPNTVTITLNFQTQSSSSDLEGGVYTNYATLNNGTRVMFTSTSGGILTAGDCQTASVSFPAASYIVGASNSLHLDVDPNTVMVVTSTVVTVTGVGTVSPCGNNTVQVCHNGRAMCIAANAVTAHLNHGDVLGACSGARTAPAPEVVSVSPNPATSSAAFSFRANSSTPAELQVYNQYGTLVATVNNKVTAGEMNTINLNSQNLPAGIYMCRLLVDGEVKSTRLEISK